MIDLYVSVETADAAIEARFRPHPLTEAINDPRPDRIG
jgi:hypothetical protein